MKLGVADIIALVKAGYKMSDIRALQEDKTEDKSEDKSEDKQEEKPSVEDLKNQIRDLSAQIKTMQEDNKEIDVSHNKDTKKPTDNELMLDLFRTFM